MSLLVEEFIAMLIIRISYIKSSVLRWFARDVLSGYEAWFGYLQPEQFNFSQGITIIILLHVI